ncbi:MULTISPECIES: DP-EP family protein [Shewanella]|uniref:DP-EP family protein n=1 Tax=Shewanella japonica TaxID=93973 RepID=A0ABN4Y915_9GAMM|nr:MULTISPECIES: DP-EP family protein [Shewanella]ARD20897.1 hypothetical protein SJ2017_0559 [Shewanella japonica]
MLNITGKATFITVTVTIDKNEVPTFSYSNETGSVEVSGESTITYLLDDLTDKGLKFVGAAFETPFDGVVDAVTTSSDGQIIQLMDLDKVVGTTKFQFVLTNTDNSLLLLSEDPQVINKGQGNVENC